MKTELYSTAGRMTTDARRSVGVIDHFVAAQAIRAEAAAQLVTTIASDLGRALGALWRKFVAWNRRQETYRELMRLDERTLADIGLTRYDVEMIAAGHDRWPERTGADEASVGAPATVVPIGNRADESTASPAPTTTSTERRAA